MIDDVKREGDFDNPSEPDGVVMKTPNGHYYEMGVLHDCDYSDCPDNIDYEDE